MEKIYVIISYLVSGVMAFFAPIQTCFHVLTFLVIVDLITAIIKCYKLYEGDNTFKNKLRVIKSHKLRRSFLKWFLYIIFIMSVYAVEKALGFTFELYFAQIGFAMLSFVELYSIGENMDLALGQKGLFIGIIKRIRKMFESKIQDNITNGEK